MAAAWIWKCLLAGCAIGACYLFRAQWLSLPATWLDVADSPRPADFAFVLDGDREVRPPLAAELYKAGFVKKILVSQVDDVLSADGRPTPRAARDNEIWRDLRRRGVPAADIQMVGNHNQSTYDEARALSNYLPAHRPVSVILVTNDYHTRRTRWIFGQVLGPHVRLSLAAAPSKEFAAERWWENSFGRRQIFDENLKFAYYFLRYGRAGHLALAIGIALSPLLLRRRVDRIHPDAAPSIIPLPSHRAAA